MTGADWPTTVSARYNMVISYLLKGTDPRMGRSCKGRRLCVGLFVWMLTATQVTGVVWALAAAASAALTAACFRNAAVSAKVVAMSCSASRAW